MINTKQVKRINNDELPNKGKKEINRHKHVTDRPPPGRCIPCRNSSTREGGWEPWKPVQGRTQERPLERNRKLRRPWRALVGAREALAPEAARKARALGGALETWTFGERALEQWALERRALEGAAKQRALEGAAEERLWRALPRSGLWRVLSRNGH